MAKTRSEALAIIEADLGQKIDAALSDVFTAIEAVRLANEQLAALAIVRKAQADLDAAYVARDAALAEGRGRNFYTKAQADATDAATKLQQLESRKQSRVAKVTAYFDALDAQAALAPVIGDIPPEAV